MNPRLVAALQVVVSIGLGALAGVLAKRSLFDVPAFTFAWLQIGSGLLFLAIYTFFIKREPWPRGLGRDRWIALIILGICNFTIVRVLFLFSLQNLPATTHVFLVNFTGLVTMVISIMLLRERPSFVQVIGALVAISGLWVFFEEVPAPKEQLGLIYVTIGLVTLAFTNNYARKLVTAKDETLSSTMISTLSLLIGAGPVILAGLITDYDILTNPAMRWDHWITALFNGLVGIALGLTIFNHALKILRSYEASILATSSAVFATVFAVPILGETVGIDQVLGMILMIGGMALSQVRVGRFAR